MNQTDQRAPRTQVAVIGGGVAGIVAAHLLQKTHDVTLLEQQSVSDDKKTVGQLLKDNGVTVTRFVRFAVGA